MMENTIKKTGIQSPAWVGDSNGNAIVSFGSGQIHYANAKNNSHLIAAAPDLMMALRIALDVICKCVDRPAGRPFDETVWQGLMSDMDIIKAAYAQAEGQSGYPTRNV